MKKFIKCMFFVCSLMLFALGRAHAASYSYDIYSALMPYQALDASKKLSIVALSVYSGRTGGTVMLDPGTTPWLTLMPGDSITFKTFLPPGTIAATFAVGSTDFLLTSKWCLSGTTTCEQRQNGQSSTIWPLDFDRLHPDFSTVTPITNTKGEYVDVTYSLPVNAPAVGIHSVNVDITISNVDAYNAWRLATSGIPGASGTGATTPTTTPLTSISLSSNTLTSGNSATSTIIPNTGATLPTCTSSNASLVSIAADKITLIGTVTQNTAVTITCGSVTASLTVKAAAGAASGYCVSETADANGKITIKIALTPATGDANKTATVWVAAWLPANAFFMNESVLFFLNSEKVWKQITTPILADVAFEKGRKLEAPTFLNVPTGVYSAEKNILAASGVKLYAGYIATGETEMKVVGPVWPGASCQ